MTTIASTLGAGSGIDTTALVTSLVSASFDPKDAALKTKETANTAKISSLGTLTNGIDAFATALGTLISGGTLQTQPSSSNSAILTASAKPGAQIGSLSAQAEVRQLAQAQSLVSASATGGAATPVGLGALTIAVGSVTKSITIDSTNNSLAGLARAINASGAGVTAAVITDANGARLTLKGATGAASAFTITPAAGADASLAAYAYGNGQTGGMTQAQQAQDAIVRMDGIDISRASNTIDDLIDGVSLKLVSAQPGTTVNLGATRPTSAITQAVSDFVAAYNELKGEIDTATVSASASADGKAGPLYGNSSIRQMQRQLAGLTSATLSTAGGYSTLAEIGVKTNLDGTLAVDGSALNAALAQNPDAVEALFNPTQHASNPLIRITSAFSATKPGAYALSSIVAGTSSTPASGTIAGVAAVTTGTKLYAASASKASGLVIEPQGDVASATVYVDAGLGGALQAIRDALRASNGVLTSLSAKLSTEKTGLATDRTKLTTDQAAYKTRLTSQFATMDTRVAAIKATQTYLTQQIDAWESEDRLMFGAPSRFAGPIANGIGAHYRDVDIAARVEGATPHGLIQILLDELVKAIDTLRAAERAGGRLPAVQSRALSILHGLEAGLDFEKGGEIARSLATIYREARRLVGLAQGPARGGALDQARAMLGEIQNAWSAIA